jgi:predicted O-methyltransferase YrrM
MKRLKQFLRTSTLGRVLLIPYRFVIALSYYRKPFKRIFPWLLRSREFTNFAYDLDDANKEYLACFVSVVTGAELAAVKRYLAEIEGDAELRTHIRRLTESSGRKDADAEAVYGRRIGWYAIVRAKKPRVVVETGVDKGLGSCVITAALMKNAAEGYPGRHYGTDINPQAGYLFKDPYSRYGEILYGDSITSLSRLTERIDLFVNDSDHSADYEMREYECVREKLTEDAVIIGDNAHCTRKLLDFAAQTHRRFLFFQEKPKAHWYPGGGIGVAF